MISIPNLIKRDKGICWLCGKAVEPSLQPGSSGLSATRDHVVPIWRGGTNRYSNIKLAHKSCNVRRSAMPREHQNSRAAQRAAKARQGVLSVGIFYMPDGSYVLRDYTPNRVEREMAPCPTLLAAWVAYQAASRLIASAGVRSVSVNQRPCTLL